MFDKLKKGLSAAKDKVEVTFSENIGNVAEKLESVANKAGKKLDDIWENEEELTKLLVMAHSLMPLPFQIVIREKHFVSMGVKSKDTIKKFIDNKKE